MRQTQLVKFLVQSPDYNSYPSVEAVNQGRVPRTIVEQSQAGAGSIVVKWRYFSNYNRNLHCTATRHMTFDEASKLIKKGDLICLRTELDGGLDPNLCNQYSWTLLMVAAMEGNTSIGKLLIERGADLDSRNKFRETPLSLAAHTGHPSFVNLLLTNGASLECHPHGNSFDIWLDWACEYGRCTAKIRALFNKERRVRAERDRLLGQVL